jgi:hypothetical protein
MDAIFANAASAVEQEDAAGSGDLCRQSRDLATTEEDFGGIVKGKVVHGVKQTEGCAKAKRNLKACGFIGYPAPLIAGRLNVGLFVIADFGFSLLCHMS